MTEKLHTEPLIEASIRHLRLPWYGTTAVAAVLLLSLLILIAYLSGSFSGHVDWGFWRLGLQPAIIVYVLVIYPLMGRLWNSATQALQRLLPQPDQNGMVAKITRYDRRWEWTALLLGAVFYLALSQPWNWVAEWLDVYSLVTSILMFGLLGLLIYGGLADTMRLAQLSRQHLEIDVFDTGQLVPVARWSLSVSLAFVGGISLSVAFQPRGALLAWSSITIYSILVGVTVLACPPILGPPEMRESCRMTTGGSKGEDKKVLGGAGIPDSPGG